MNKPAKQEEPKIYSLLPHKMADIAKVLPKHITPERAMRLIGNTLRKNQKLAEAASKNPISFFLAVTHISQLGLEIDGRLAHLVPFGVETVPVIDYKGFVQLALRSGQYSYVHADSICENDEFDFDLGQVTRHKIDFRKPRGEPFAYYAMARTKDGHSSFCVMTKEEIEKVRLGSPGRSSEPWTKWYDEMAKKTVFKRLCKWLTLSPELRDAVEADDASPEEERFKAARPVFDSEPMQVEYNEQVGDPIPDTQEAEKVAVNGGGK